MKNTDVRVKVVGALYAKVSEKATVAAPGRCTCMQTFLEETPCALILAETILLPICFNTSDI